MRERARTALERVPCYDAAPDDLVPVIEDGGLTRRHEGRGIEVERRVVSVHVDVSGKCDAPVTQDHVRREAGGRRGTRDEPPGGGAGARLPEFSARAPNPA